MINDNCILQLCMYVCIYIYIYDHPGVDNTCLLNQNHPIKWSCLKVTYSIWYIPGCYLWIDYSNLTATSLEWLVLGKETLVILQQADSSCEISHPQKSNEQSLGSMVSDFAFLAIRLGSSRAKKRPTSPLELDSCSTAALTRHPHMALQYHTIISHWV